MWCILLYLRAIFVATPTGEVSEVEILLRFDGVPEPGSIVRIRAHLLATVRILPCPPAFCPWTNIHVHERKCYF